MFFDFHTHAQAQAHFAHLIHTEKKKNEIRISCWLNRDSCYTWRSNPLANQQTHWIAVAAHIFAVCILWYRRFADLCSLWVSGQIFINYCKICWYKTSESGFCELDNAFGVNMWQSRWFFANLIDLFQFSFCFILGFLWGNRWIIGFRGNFRVKIQFMFFWMYREWKFNLNLIFGL